MTTLLDTRPVADTPLTLESALKIIGGLSAPSKMPGYSWSTSAEDCITGSKLRKVKGSTCSTCYAMKNNYTFPNVKAAHRRRMAGTANPRFVEAFTFVLTQRYKRTRRTYMLDGVMIQENRFRWYDAGDLHSVEMLENICAIAVATPQLRHWLPTREYKIVSDYLAEHGSFPDNLTVRMSTPMIGERMPHQPMGLSFSTVDHFDDDIARCPAGEQENLCSDCSTCWTETNVGYVSH